MSEINDEKKLAAFRKLVAEYAEAKGKLEYLTHFRKSQRAILMKEYGQLPEFKTSAAQETQANADKRYIDILEGIQAATIEEEKLKWELQIHRWTFEKWKTKEMREMAEMKLR